MPLLPYFNNMWYGSASGAMEDTTPTIEVEASIKGTLTGEVQVLAGQLAPYLKGTMGRTQTLLVQGVGEMHLALPKKIGTIALNVSIGATPSAYDIAQAVWGQVASAVNVTGTTGAKLNSAGGAADPWADPKALTVGKFIALK
jgi:hypothetical protein